MRDKKPPFLSKSKYLNGLQCEKLLWYAYNSKHSFPPIDDSQQALFDEGKRVGEFAQKLFPGGIKVGRELVPEQLHAKSMSALKSRKPVFEAGFVFERAYALSDILSPAEEDSWDLYEVKSSTGVKNEYISDLAFQKYTYDNAGVKIRKTCLVYINNQYVKKGRVNPEELFTINEVSVDSFKEDIRARIDHMLGIIALDESPGKKIGLHCDIPYECPLKAMCWKFLPERNHVFVLSRARDLAFELVDKGIVDILNIPSGIKLSDKHLIQIESHKNGSAYINKQALRDFRDKLEYPLSFLDFETIGSAIPVYELSRPYEQVPFQFSLHVIETEGATPKHYSYLASGPEDSRPEILNKLKELLGKKGSIVSYYAVFEINALERAVCVNPEFSGWFESIKPRFVDLLEPFRGFYYYHPSQEGSNSIKAVLPAITGNSYKNLEIANGSQASREYYKVTFGTKISEQEILRVRRALEKYCCLDTQGMIDILDVLKKVS